MQVCTLLQNPTTQFFPGRMPFLPPNQQCQSTEVSLTVLHFYCDGFWYEASTLTLAAPSLLSVELGPWLSWLFSRSSAVVCSDLRRCRENTCKNPDKNIAFQNVRPLNLAALFRSARVGTSLIRSWSRCVAYYAFDYRDEYFHRVCCVCRHYCQLVLFVESISCGKFVNT